MQLNIADNEYILTIQSKYCCHIIPATEIEPVKIRIGCKTYPVSEWTEELQEKLADENDRKWWDTLGKKIFNILKNSIE